MVPSSWFTLLVCFLIRNAEGNEDSDEEVVPKDSVLEFDSLQFSFHFKEVTYSQAAALCESMKAEDSHLAKVDTPEKAKALADFMADAWLDVGHLWIGGTRLTGNQWQWTDGDSIPAEAKPQDDFIFPFPPWLHDVARATFNQDCLSIDRKEHDKPIFVDVSCAMERPFICQRNKGSRETELGANVTIFGKYYLFYHGSKTFEEAVRYCKKVDTELAMVNNISITRIMAKTMLKTRPNFEAGWIGMHKGLRSWVWIESGKEVKYTSAEYYSSPFQNKSGNVILPAFPPWYNEPGPGSDCVILDRHLGDEPRFVAIPCDKKRDFICKQPGDDDEDDKNKDNIRLIRHDKEYIFFLKPKLWVKALKECFNEGTDSTLLTLGDIYESKWLVDQMRKYQLDHLWIGGLVVTETWSRWYWTSRPMGALGAPIPMQVDSLGYPPWCDNETNIENACLNLDKQSFSVPLMYGIPCSNKQKFVCEKAAYRQDIDILVQGKLAKMPAESRLQSWQDAYDICRKEIGRLFAPTVTNNRPDEELIKTLESDSELPHQMYFIDGGYYRGNGTWVRGSEILEMQTVNNPSVNDTMALYVEGSTLLGLYAIKSTQSMKGKPICEIGCDLKEVQLQRYSKQWVCDSQYSENFDEKIKGVSCVRRCKGREVLRGPDTFTCHNKWTGKRFNAPPSYTTCLPLKDAFSLIGEHANVPETVKSVIFFMDFDMSNDHVYKTQEYVLINLIEYYRYLEPDISVAVLGLGNFIKENRLVHAKIVYQGKPTEGCKGMANDILASMPGLPRESRDFGAGLDLAQELIKESFVKTHIIILVAGENERKTYREQANKLKENATVFAFSLNKDAPAALLTDLSSSNGSHSYATKFYKPSDLVLAIDTFMYVNCPKCTCRKDYTMLIEGVMKMDQEIGEDYTNPPYNEVTNTSENSEQTEENSTEMTKTGSEVTGTSATTVSNSTRTPGTAKTERPISITMAQKEFERTTESSK